ncbi:MAG: ADP-L-glycero-D-manno-heptose-6-epimerase [Candidatus Anoxychlamydiales bacterium]|nr:ADP-L-glycero-D-manno-heptose-6-epimerase [Candidatus Anoxychlamydiales bacterium]NGX41423.1 ADP-L-glycero-D-manno-heptose-6-epimerase [Candidatus Anoxychlamydiales bacterium]
MKQSKIFKDQIIIVTGASGFIGSCTLRHLNDLGYTNLVLVDDLKNDKWKNLVGKKFLNLIFKEELFDFLKGRENEIEAIIHLGACSSTICKDSNYLYENNFRFTQKLCEYAIENDQRFIYASSAATYGDGNMGFSDDENLLESLRPINMYGYSKHLFDLWAKDQKILDKIVGLKYFNVFGPNENHKDEMSSMIYKMEEKIQRDGKISLFKSNDPKNYKDGEQKRDFIYVKDAVKMTCLLIEDAFKDVSGIFNIGSGKATTWNELATALFNALNMPVKIEYIDMPKELEGQYQNFTKAEMTKFQKFYKDKFEITSIEDSVKNYVQNYLLKRERW